MTGQIWQWGDEEGQRREVKELGGISTRDPQGRRLFCGRRYGACRHQRAAYNIEPRA